MTIDTSREAVERLLDGVTRGPWSFHDKGIHPHQYICAPPQAYEFGHDSPVVAYVVGTDSDANARFIAAARELVPALLAERDAALAEVARLSTPPDAAEVRAWALALDETARGHDDEYEDTGHAISKRLADEAREVSGFLTRLSQALTAETAKREAMEAELRSVEIDLFEAEDKFHIASFYISDEQTKTCVMDRVKWMAKAGSRVRATLAKHGSK